MPALIENMYRYIGQTVTIFTTSGGLSGRGFTGVLLSVDNNNVRLLCNVGASPSCPLGSACTNRMNSYGTIQNNFFFGNNNFNGNPLGSVAIIPICSIACFTHNAI